MFIFTLVFYDTIWQHTFLDVKLAAITILAYILAIVTVLAYILALI